MNKEVWDYYSFTISDYWLSALINGEYSGLDDDEVEVFSEWEQSSLKLVAGTATSHWDFDDEPYFGKDDITGLMSNVVEVRLLFKKDKR